MRFVVGRPWTVLLLLLSLLVALPARSQPFGAEFRVSDGSSGSGSYFPSVACDGAGSFVVVWSGDRGGPGQAEVYGRHVSGLGVPGAGFRVNTVTSGEQGRAAVGIAPGGRYLVAWSSLDDGSTSGLDVRGQRFDGGGPLGAEFRVNASTTGAQYSPAVASDSGGGFLVVWQSSAPGSNRKILGQVFTADGNPSGSQFQVNAYTTGNQSDPTVAGRPGGGFLVAWHSDDDGSLYGVFGRVLDASGAPVGPEFRINTTTGLNQTFPQAAFTHTASGTNEFVVVWQSYAQSGDVGYGVFGQRFGAAGTPLGPEFRVNTTTTLEQRLPSVASDGKGSFVVVWTGGPFLGYDIFGQGFSSAGTPVGKEFRVNSYTTQMQSSASVKWASTGRFLVAWRNWVGYEASLSGQLFSGIPVTGDADGNGTLNVSDVLYLINNLFAGGPAAIGNADVNGDHVVNVSDVLYLINHLFAGGPPPV